MKDENRKLRITPRARALYAQLKTATDDREIASLGCALHGAVGLYPWSDTSVSEVLTYLAEAEGL
jgi:hypothetical protein